MLPTSVPPLHPAFDPATYSEAQATADLASDPVALFSQLCAVDTRLEMVEVAVNAQASVLGEILQALQGVLVIGVDRRAFRHQTSGADEPCTDEIAGVGSPQHEAPENAPSVHAVAPGADRPPHPR